MKKRLENIFLHMTQERTVVCEMSASDIVSETMRDSKEYGTY